MSTGVIFDIKEMTVHDGPGVRVTIFFQGCPLRCLWCHNPEGLSIAPPIRRITAKELAQVVKKNAEMLQHLKGGVTISGGEPLMQPQFLLDTLEELSPLHRVLQTSGYGDEETFKQALKRCELVLFDLKQMSAEIHREFTGKGNELILRNLEHLKDSGKEFVIRLPMIPGVNINELHFMGVVKALSEVKEQVRIEILPYNPMAGAKYAKVGMEYRFVPEINENEELQYPVHIFDEAGLSYRVL